MPKIKEIEGLDVDVEELLKRNKRNKIDEATRKLQRLDQNIDDLVGNTENAFRKMTELKSLLESAKQNQGRDDQELASKLRNIEVEILKIEKDLKNTDDNVNDLRKKRNESKKHLDEIRAGPDRFSPQQIDALLLSLDDQNERADELVDRIRAIEKEEDKKIQELKDLVNSSDARRAHLNRI